MLENNNILYIPSVIGYCIEKIDLRENKWEIIVEKRCSDTMKDLFGIKILSTGNSQRFLIPEQNCYF